MFTVDDAGDDISFVATCKQDFRKFAQSEMLDQNQYAGTGDSDCFIVKDFHVRWVRAVEEHDRVAITAFTGSGKTSALGVIYTIWKVLFEGADCLIVSSNMQQSTKILAEIKHHITNSEWLEDLKPEDRNSTWTKTEIELTNGGHVYCKPFSEGVKGVHVDYVLCDEAAEFKEHDVYERYVKTRAARKNGTVCLISTPVHENDLMAKLSEGTEPRRCPDCGNEVGAEDQDTYVCVTPTCDRYDEEVEPDFNPKISERGYWNDTFAVEDEDGQPTFPSAFDEDDIEQLRRENPEAFQREYLCQALAVEGDLFDPNDIMECYDNEDRFREETSDDAYYYLGCMPPGSKISTDRGVKNIEDISDECLLTHTGSYKPITERSVRQYEGDLYEITPSYQPFPLKLTAEHPCYVYRDGEFTWVDASDVSTSDKLAIPLTEVTEELDVTPRESYIIGRWVADGWKNYGDNHNRLSICFGDRSEADKLETLISSDSIYRRERDTAIELNFHNKRLWSLAEPFGERADKKKIPPSIYKWSEDAIFAFLKGYFDGDGCIHYNEEKNELVVNCVSTSLSLILGIQRLLGSLGIVSRCGVLRSGGEMNIEDRTVDTKQTYQLFVATKYAIRLLDKWGVDHSYEHGNRGRSYAGEIIDEYLVVNIRSIESYDYSGSVYNFEVEDDHSYCNQNIATHNCDFAISKQGDYSVFTVIEQPPDRDDVVIRYMERVRGLQLAEQENRIENLHRIFDFKTIVVDETNFGQRTLQNLRDRGLPVEGQSFERKARNNLIVTLKTMIEKEEVTIPYDQTHDRTRRIVDTFYNEMLGFGSSTTQSGAVTYQTTAAHDDTVMSVAMALSAVEDTAPAQVYMASGTG